MENASKALIMAAEIIVGVLIVSIGVYLFNTLGQYSAETTEKMEDAQLEQYNQQFLQYYGTSTIEGSEPQPIKCTIHEVVGLANLAKKLNADNGFIGIQEISDTSDYIRIDLKIGVKTYTNLENMSEDELIQLVKDNSLNYTTNVDGSTSVETKYFKCGEEPGIGSVTRRVNYMKFVEF